MVVESAVDKMMEAKDLTDEQKQKINEQLLNSGGILRDYDNNEIMHPLSIPVLNVLEQMLKNTEELFKG